MTSYLTIDEAKNAMCLDTGFDPFLHGPVKAAGRTWRKVSVAALRAMGYRVMTAAERREESARRSRLPIMEVFCWARDCDGKEGDGTEWDYSLTLYTPSPRDDQWQRYGTSLDLGMIQAKTRAEARAIIAQKYAGQFSAIQFGG